MKSRIDVLRSTPIIPRRTLQTEYGQMQVRFATNDLQRLEEDADFDGGFPKEVVRKYRMRVQLIRGATDERDFYAMKSLHYEKLKGSRSHQHSTRLNDQWRLVIEIEKSDPKNLIVIVSVEDYH